MMKSLTTACAVIAASANGVEMFGSLFDQALNGGFRGFGDDSAQYLSSKPIRQYKPVSRSFRDGNSFVKTFQYEDPNYVEEKLQVCKPGDNSIRCRNINYASFGDDMNGGSVYSSNVVITSTNSANVYADNTGRTDFYGAGEQGKEYFGNANGAYGQIKEKVHG